MKNLGRLTACLLLIAALSAGCAAGAREVSIVSVDAIPPTEAPAPTYAFPSSKPGFTTIKGELLVISPNVVLPSENDGIFLVPIDDGSLVAGIPQFDTAAVPQAEVDESTGKFVFTDIEPGTYVVVVETVTLAQIPARVFTDDTLAILNISEQDRNQTIDLGYLRFP
jgi:hypothetical protein